MERLDLIERRLDRIEAMLQKGEPLPAIQLGSAGMNKRFSGYESLPVPGVPQCKASREWGHAGIVKCSREDGHDGKHYATTPCLATWHTR